MCHVYLIFLCSLHGISLQSDNGQKIMTKLWASSHNLKAIYIMHRKNSDILYDLYFCLLDISKAYDKHIKYKNIKIVQLLSCA